MSDAMTDTAADRAYEAWASEAPNLVGLRWRAQPLTYDAFLAGFLAAHSAQSARIAELEAALERAKVALGPLIDVSRVAADLVPDDAVVDVTYTHANGKKYGIVQSRMAHFRLAAAVLGELEEG